MDYKSSRLGFWEISAYLGTKDRWTTTPGESGSRLILLLDPTLAYGQLAFCSQYSCRQSRPRGKKSPQTREDVSCGFPECSNRPEDGRNEAVPNAHGPQDTVPGAATQGSCKSLLNKADDIFRGDNAPDEPDDY